MAMRDETRMLLESMTGCSRTSATKQVVDAAEKGSFPDDLWHAVSETGVPLAALPELAGGADAEWSDLYAVLRVAGRYAAPIPLAETMLAGWIAAAAGLELTDAADDGRTGARRRHADIGTRRQWLAAVRPRQPPALCHARPGGSF